MAGSAARFDRWYRRLAIGVPYLWLVDFPAGAVPDRAEASACRRPSWRSRPIARCFDLAAGWQGIKDFVAALSLRQLRRCSATGSMSSSYLRSLQVAAVSTAILLAIGLSDRLRHGARAALAAADAGDGGDPAVLDRVPDPHLCLDHHPAARRPAERRAAGDRHRSTRRATWLATDTAIYHRHRLFLSAVHGAAALRGAREDGRDACWKPPPISAVRAGRRSGW